MSSAAGTLTARSDAESLVVDVRLAVDVMGVPATHLAPAWDALDDVAAAVQDFLDRQFADTELPVWTRKPTCDQGNLSGCRTGTNR
jgi:hypothetical protein